MSRTLKDRPHWVRRNDPKVEKYAMHDHKIVCREQIGEEPVMRRRVSKDGWHMEEELDYMRPIFRRWVETVPCTLEMPESGPSEWWGARRNESNEDKRTKKHCYWNLEYYPGGPSGKEYKRLTHGAERSKVRTQLHNAIRDNGSWVEYPAWQWYSDDYFDQEYPWPEYIDWEDVDIRDDSKYASRGWWDW